MSELPVIVKTYDLLKYLVPQLAKFPKDQRYLLGQRIEEHTLSLLEDFIEAQYNREKTDILRRANLRLVKLRYLVRLSKDMGFLAINRYEHICRLLEEIGTMCGGWLKSKQCLA